MKSDINSVTLCETHQIQARFKDLNVITDFVLFVEILENFNPSILFPSCICSFTIVTLNLKLLDQEGILFTIPRCSLNFGGSCTRLLVVKCSQTFQTNLKLIYFRQGEIYNEYFLILFSDAAVPEFPPEGPIFWLCYRDSCFSAFSTLSTLPTLYHGLIFTMDSVSNMITSF